MSTISLNADDNYFVLKELSKGLISWGGMPLPFSVCPRVDLLHSHFFKVQTSNQHWQRRQSGLKSGGLWNWVKKLGFYRKFSKNFDFFW